MDRLENVGVTALHRGRLAHEVDRDLDANLLLEVDLIEVDVDRALEARVRLDLAHQHLLGLGAVYDQVDEVGAAALDEDLLELQSIEHQRRRLGAVAVDDGRQLALTMKAAGPLAQEFSLGGFELQSVSPNLTAPGAT